MQIVGDVESQVVQGTNYRFTVKAGDKYYKAQVWGESTCYGVLFLYRYYDFVFIQLNNRQLLMGDQFSLLQVNCLRMVGLMKLQSLRKPQHLDMVLGGGSRRVIHLVMPLWRSCAVNNYKRHL